MKLVNECHGTVMKGGGKGPQREVLMLAGCRLGHFSRLLCGGQCPPFLATLLQAAL